MTTVATRYFRITGHVQGVGFRYSTQQEAQRLGLSGWVRNCPDKSVEVRAAGISESLDALEQWLHQGPRGAHVTQVQSSVPDDDNAAAEPELHFSDFEILR